MHIRMANAEPSDLSTDGGVAQSLELREVPRWDLYRLLADSTRVRLLALTSAEELSVGELAELLREGQPKVSRHAAALRDAGLVSSRKQGTWVLLRIKPGVANDAVVRDAIRAGRTSCEHDGTWERIEHVVGQRDTHTREFFARGGKPIADGPPSEIRAYLVSLRTLLPHHHLAIDAGTGDGALLDVLAPIFDRVVAIDRSASQLDLARERARRRGYDNVDFVAGEIDGPSTRASVLGAMGHGADAVFASRVLHHAAKPDRAIAALVDLARKPSADREGGLVAILDYAAHEDEALRDAQADLWLGFSPSHLVTMAKAAGLVRVTSERIPQSFTGDGPDRHLEWNLLSGVRGDASGANFAHPRETHHP
jgi:DNA-binding transcriptional ArsR family regulator/ubiquinone/menaquinone biosynthesis C-methylase UbiE